MVKKPCIFVVLLLILFGVQNVSATNYKLGVLLFVYHDFLEKDGTLNESLATEAIQKIKSEIALNNPHREDDGDTLDLVIQVPITWSDIQPSEGKGPDLSNFSQFADILDEEQVKMTPLLGVNGVPKWVLDKYKNDKPQDKCGDERHHDLPISPSSTMWREGGEAEKWIEIVTKNFLVPFIEKGVISEILVSNEVMYYGGSKEEQKLLDNEAKNSGEEECAFLKSQEADRGMKGEATSFITSYDDASKEAWNSFLERKKDYPMPNNFAEAKDEQIDLFLEFREVELAKLLKRLRLHVKGHLSENGVDDIPISWKLASYAMDKEDGFEEFRGLDSQKIFWTRLVFKDDDDKDGNLIECDKVCAGVDFIALNIYEGNTEIWNSEGSDRSDSDFYEQGKNRIHDVEKLITAGKFIYMSELGKGNISISKEEVDDGKKIGIPIKFPATNTEIQKWISHTKDNGFTHWSFFTWNGSPMDNITPCEKEGLKQAFNEIIPLPSNEVVENDYGYTDIPPCEWYSTPIYWLKDHNMLKDDSVVKHGDGTFHPAENITRADFLKMLLLARDSLIREFLDRIRKIVKEKDFKSKPEYKKLNNFLEKAGFSDVKEPPQKYEPVESTGFGDVEAYHPASGYIKHATEKRIIEGYSEGFFKPDDEIKRAEAAKMVTLAFGFADAEPDEIKQVTCPKRFADLKGEHEWYCNFIDALEKAVEEYIGNASLPYPWEVITGYGPDRKDAICGYPGQTRFCPGKSIQRDEAATIICRTYALKSERLGFCR